MEMSTTPLKDPKANTNQELGLRVKPIDEEDSKTSMQDDHHCNCKIITLKKLPLQECDQELQEEEQNHLYFNFIVPFRRPATPPSSPKLNNLDIPSYEVLEKNDNEDNFNNNLEILSYEVPKKNDNVDNSNFGYKTPTSLDRKISMMLKPLGALRKKITRSAACYPSLMRVLSKELESMFTNSFMENLNDVDKEM